MLENDLFNSIKSGGANLISVPRESVKNVARVDQKVSASEQTKVPKNPREAKLEALGVKLQEQGRSYKFHLEYKSNPTHQVPDGV